MLFAEQQKYIVSTSFGDNRSTVIRAPQTTTKRSDYRSCSFMDHDTSSWEHLLVIGKGHLKNRMRQKIKFVGCAGCQHRLIEWHKQPCIWKLGFWLTSLNCILHRLLLRCMSLSIQRSQTMGQTRDSFLILWRKSRLYLLIYKLNLLYYKPKIHPIQQNTHFLGQMH